MSDVDLSKLPSPDHVVMLSAEQLRVALREYIGSHGLVPGGRYWCVAVEHALVADGEMTTTVKLWKDEPKETP